MHLSIKNLLMKIAPIKSQIEELESLRAERDTYKHAFETTAIDRDRLQAELDIFNREIEASDRGRLEEEIRVYRHAFETTTQDRDRLSSSISSMSDSLDAGFFRVNLAKLANQPEAEYLRLSAMWEELFEKRKYSELAVKILEISGVVQALPLPEDYTKNITAYWMACYYCRNRDFDKAQYYAEMFNYHASIDGTDMFAYDVSQSSRLSRYKQMEAIGYARPGALVVSLPKSASAFMSQAISDIFEVPIIRSSLGEGMRSFVVARWASQIAEGGAVTHEHFQALPVNIDALSRSGINKIWILVRDPRDAAYSLRKMDGAYDLGSVMPSQLADDSEGSKNQQFIVDCRYFTQWISDWIDASLQTDLSFEISFITYDELTTDLPLVIAKMFSGHLNAELSGRVKSFLSQWDADSEVRRNFRSGKGREWCSQHSAETIEEVNAAIPESVRSVLKIED